MDIDKLRTGAEIAERIGLSRQRFHELVNEEKAPSPIVTRRGVQLWNVDTIDAWQASRVKDKGGRPRKTPSPKVH